MVEPPIPLRIGIVGAGLCGLATAAFLVRRGHAVDVLERVPQPRPLGAGLLLQPVGASLLDEIDALSAILPTAARISRLDGRAVSGETLIALDYAELGAGFHGLGLSRPAIWQALLRAATQGGATLRAGCGVAAVNPAADTAELVLMDGSRQEYDLVVVAAGTHTGLWRRRWGQGARLYPWGCLWATVPLPANWPTDVLIQRCKGTTTMIGILPIGSIAGQPHAALYWSIRNDAVAAWRAAPIADWRDAVARAFPEAEPLVAALSRAQIEHAAYRDVWTDPPFNGRAVLVGDAAHGTSPQLGQGTTQALQDACALADALDLPGSVTARLSGYWSERRRRTAYYRLASRVLTPVFQSSLPGIGWVRDRVAGPVGRLPLVHRQALLTLAGLKNGLFGADAPAPTARR